MVVWTCAERRIRCQEQPFDSTLEAVDRRGRPKKRQMDAITEDICAMGLAPEDAQMGKTKPRRRRWEDAREKKEREKDFQQLPTKLSIVFTPN